MTFLQPLILWGLPFVLLPVLIHLINRMRHRPLPWAAMLFLTQARRASTRFSRLREWLILACRMLVIAALVLALARPVTGGWLGWLLHGSPDTVYILLDRSASMETQITGSAESRRQRALKRVAEAARSLGTRTRFILLDSVMRTPRILPSAAVLEDSALLRPTETGADFPGLLLTAFDALTRSPSGRTELWLVSDLQASDWQPDNPAWEAVRAKYRVLPQPVTFRLLALDTPVTDNAAIHLTQVQRTVLEGKPALAFDFEVRLATAGRRTLPLGIHVGQQTTTLELALDSTNSRCRHTVPVGAEDAPCLGWLELPHDQNPADNRSFFACGPVRVTRSLVVASEPAAAKVLTLAAAPAPDARRQRCEVLTPEAALRSSLQDVALLQWQAPLPPAEQQSGLRAFVEQGGVLLLYPPGVAADTALFGGPRWGAPENAQAATPFRVATWMDDEGPLARTAAGARLPLDQLALARRQLPLAAGAALATGPDGTPFLSRLSFGRGQLVSCSTLPVEAWSNLADGLVLVPLVQRLATAGARRFEAVEYEVCGSRRAGRELQSLLAVADDRPAGTAPGAVAGVFKHGEGMLVMNRPAAEDVPGYLAESSVSALFRGLALYQFHDRRVEGEGLQSELWRGLILAALLCLAAEGWLTRQTVPLINPHDRRP